MYSLKKLCSNVLPAGTYRATVSEIQLKEREPGHINMEVHYVISEGDYAKRTIIDTIYEKAMSFRLKPFAQALSLDFDREFDSLKDMYDWCKREAEGKAVMIEVSVRTYNGNEYNDVKTWAPVPSSTVTTADVMAEFETTPDTMPRAPKITDLPEASDTDVFPSLDINDDDLPI